jgi:hypothetical protein
MVLLVEAKGNRLSAVAGADETGKQYARNGDGVPIPVAKHVTSSIRRKAEDPEC